MYLCIFIMIGAKKSRLFIIETRYIYPNLSKYMHHKYLGIFRRGTRGWFHPLSLPSGLHPLPYLVHAIVGTYFYLRYP